MWGLVYVLFFYIFIGTTADLHIAHERLILDPLLFLLFVNNVLDVLIVYLWMYRWVLFG